MNLLIVCTFPLVGGQPTYLGRHEGGGRGAHPEYVSEQARAARATGRGAGVHASQLKSHTQLQLMTNE